MLVFANVYGCATVEVQCIAYWCCDRVNKANGLLFLDRVVLVLLLLLEFLVELLVVCSVFRRCLI